MLLLEGNENMEGSMCRPWGEGLGCTTGPGIAAARCDGGRAPLRQTTVIKASLRLERYSPVFVKEERQSGQIQALASGLKF